MDLIDNSDDAPWEITADSLGDVTKRIIIFILFGITGCQSSNKKEMLKIYSNDENYITLKCEIIEINNTNKDILVSIKCEELKQYIPYEKDICKYLIFSEQTIDIHIGDIVFFVTSNVRFEYIEWLPIVSITKNNINILKFEEGKKNLINWVNQLQMK